MPLPLDDLIAPPTAVVIPARNEERTVGKVVADARRALPGAAVFVVDDASADATGRRAGDAGAVVVRSPRHAGYAGALRIGYEVALDGGAERLAQVDGDGQHECADLPLLLDGLAAADLVIGSRFLDPRGGYEPTSLRRMGMAGCRWLWDRAGGSRLTDPTSGFRALRQELAATIVEEGFPGGLTEISLLIRLRRRGLRISEVPVRMYPSNGHSMHDGLAGGAHALRIGWDIAGLLARPGAR